MRDICITKYDFWISLSKRIPDITIINKSVNKQI